MFVPAPPQAPLRIHPAGRWIVVGLLLPFVGVVAALLFGYLSYEAMRDQVIGFQRVTAPGSSEVRLAAGHDYTLYFEDTDPSSDEPRPTVTVTLTDPSGQPVHLNPDRHVPYQIAGYQGNGEYRFHTGHGGTYRLTGEGAPGVTLAVGAELTPSIMRTVLIPVAVFMIGMFSGFILTVVTIIRRERYRRRHTAAPVAGGWAG
ncbi:hypothetical protein [Nocardia sp. NPDC004722]